MSILLNILGIAVILALAFLLSWKKKKVSWKLIVKALIAQAVIAVILTRIPLGQLVVSKVSDVVTTVINYGKDGLGFVFGPLADAGAPSGFIFAIQVLGNIVFLSALVSLLYYIGVLGFVVKWLGKAVGKLMGTSEVESFVAVANMFLGQTDSPILVNKYIKKMTESEIFVILVSGMGSMSVSILGGYTVLGIPMEYLLISSTLVPIGSILIAKIIFPQTESTLQVESVKMDNKGANANVIDAIAEGAGIGMQMAFAIGASLIAMISLVALMNGILDIFGITMQQILGYLFSPFGYLMGLSGSEVLMEGQLLGSKIVLNEFIAFQSLGEMIGSMSRRSGMIMSISLSGFANLSSLGICVAGIGVLCPEKRGILAKLVFRAMLGGILVSLLSAMIVGLVMI